MKRWGRLVTNVLLSMVMMLGMCPVQGFANEGVVDVDVEVASSGADQDMQPHVTMEEELAAPVEVEGEFADLPEAEEDDILLEAQYADVVEVTVTEDGQPQAPQRQSDLIVPLHLINLSSYQNRAVDLRFVNDTTVTQEYYSSFRFVIHQVNTTFDLNGCAVDMTNHMLMLANGQADPLLTITDAKGGGVLNNCLIVVRIYKDNPVSAAFRMCGGTINGCVQLLGLFNQSMCQMTAGTITNTSGLKDGVGVDVGSDSESTLPTTFTMTGGSITGCTGGGVKVGENGTFRVSGTPVVTDNTKDGVAQNVFLSEGRTVTVVGALTDGARIGVTTATKPTADKPVVFTSDFGANNPDTDPSAFFVSDDPNYYVALENGEAVLKPHAHAWQCEVSGGVLTATCTNENCTAKGGNVQTLTLSAEDKAYDGKPASATVLASADWSAIGAVVGDVTYYEGDKNLDAAPKDAGAYEARVTVQVEGDEQVLKAPFSIARIPLTVTARDNVVAFGLAPAGAGVTYAGFVGGEGAGVLTGELSYDFGGCQSGSPAGTYPITPRGLSSRNYDVAYRAGTLTVEPAPLPGTVATKAVATMQRSGKMRAVTGVGKVVGAAGKGRRLEALRLSLSNKPLSGGIEYRGYVQKVGWQAWRANGSRAGTERKNLRMEAIQVRLTGKMAFSYDVYYRVCARGYGWMGWAKNGAKAGSIGKRRSVEAVQIVVVRKGDRAPGRTYNGVKRAYAKAFVK